MTDIALDPNRTAAPEHHSPPGGEALRAGEAGNGATAPAGGARTGSSDCAAFTRVVGADCAQRSWWLGGGGRDQVAARLARLGERWKVLHGVPVPDAGAADQLVVGPAGVFAVTTRQQPGSTVWVGGETVLVDGAPTDWVGLARKLAHGASATLSRATGRSVPVTGLVVVVGAHDGFVDHAQPRDDVRVLTRRDVDGWLSGRPTIWGDDVVDMLFAAARLPQTWEG